MYYDDLYEDDVYHDDYYYAPTKDERKWAMFCHLSALSAYIGVPFGSVLGPLVIWLLKRDESAFVDQHGREAINFHLSMALYIILATLLCVILIGFPILFVLIALSLVSVVIATVRASDGRSYRYPMTIQFMKTTKYLY